MLGIDYTVYFTVYLKYGNSNEPKNDMTYKINL